MYRCMIIAQVANNNKPPNLELQRYNKCLLNSIVCVTFKVGIVKFQGFRVSVTSYFRHFVAPCVKRGLKITFSQIKKSSNFCYCNFKSWYNKVSRILRFGHLLFSSFCCPLCEKRFENSILSNQKILELLLLKLLKLV